jgi:hypothetical protein
MKGSPATFLSVAKWVTVTSVILALGCQTAHQATQFLYPEPQWNTELPPGVSSNPGEFTNSVARRGFLPSDSFHIRARAGRCPLCVVQVRIQALGETWRIKHDSAPAMGVPVAVIRNLDSAHVEARYGFRPDTQAVYYFWIDRRPGSTRARVTVLQVPVHGGVVTAGHQTNFWLCHYRSPGTPPTSDADFLEYRSHGACTVPLADGSMAISTASMFPGASMVAIMARFIAKTGRGISVSQGGWIDCNSGCCR